MLATLVIASLLAAPADAPARSARLLDETSRLEGARPRLWPPLVLCSAGSVGALSGVGLIWAGVFAGYWYAFSFAVGAVVLLTAGIVLFAVGLPLAIVGAVRLYRTVQARREVDRQLELLEHEDPATITIATF